MNNNFNTFIKDNKLPIGVGLASFVAGIGVGIGINYIRDRRRVVRHVVPSKPLDIEALDRFVEEEERKVGIVRPRNLELEVSDNVLAELEEGDRIINVQRGGEEFVPPILEETEVEVEETPEEETVVERRVFAHSSGLDDKWDYDEELAKRTPDQPYVIHRDEFYENTHDYSQYTLTYYSGDDILVDEEDAPIYGYHKVVGDLKFGHGSQGDPNVFFVRNDKLRAEYEIINDPGLYSVEVLGLSIEDNVRARRVREQREEKGQGLKHSNSGVPKFRQE